MVLHAHHRSRKVKNLKLLFNNLFYGETVITYRGIIDLRIGGINPVYRLCKKYPVTLSLYSAKRRSSIC